MGMFADRTKNVFFSGTVKYAEKARQMLREGKKVRSFGKQPDISNHIKEASIKMIDSERSARYTDFSGMPELREAIHKKLKRENGIDADPNSEITVTIGGKGALFLAYMAMLNPGDEVIIQDPAWVTIHQCIPLMGAMPVSLPLREEEGWGINEGDIEQHITPRTKMIVINDPHNPTGTVLDKKTVNYIADIVRENNLIIITDECYEKIIDPSLKHYSMASLPDMKNRTISVFTTTKIYNMYGWRIGYIVANKKISKKLLAIHSQTVGCAPSISQAGAIAALGENIASGNMTMQDYNKQYQEARDTVVDGLNEIPRVSCVRGRGGYWVFPNLMEFNMSSMELHEALLNYGFCFVPGIEFGKNGENHLRVSYGLGLEEIKESLEHLKNALSDI
jgi:aspartate/methionine/tyrosine aminotransferase